MTEDLFLEALLLGEVYKKWTLTDDGTNLYYSRRLTDEEYEYLVNDLSSTFPISTTINTLLVTVLADGADRSAYLSVQV